MKTGIRSLLVFCTVTVMGAAGMGVAQADSDSGSAAPATYPSEFSPQKVRETELAKSGVSTAAFASICYQAHVADKGWQDWTCNGWTAGTVGENKAIEKVRIQILGSGTYCAQAHVRNVGWLDADCQAAPGFVEVGTTGQALPMEALRFWSKDGGSLVRGQAHVQNLGWMNPTQWAYWNEIGTTGRGLTLEAIKLWI